MGRLVVISALAASLYLWICADYLFGPLTIFTYLKFGILSSCLVLPFAVWQFSGRLAVLRLHVNYAFFLYAFWILFPNPYESLARDMGQIRTGMNRSQVQAIMVDYYAERSHSKDYVAFTYKDKQRMWEAIVSVKFDREGVAYTHWYSD